MVDFVCALGFLWRNNWSEPMEPRITARRCTLSTSHRSFIVDRIARLEQVYDGITDVHVVLEKESTGPQSWNAEVLANVFRRQIAGHARNASFEIAVDDCVEQLRRQLLKHKAKLRRTV
jgi:ribosomal subunit interface protein